MPGKHYTCQCWVLDDQGQPLVPSCKGRIDMVRQCAVPKCGHEIGYCSSCGGDERAVREMIEHHAEHRVPITKRDDGAYTAGPPPDGRSVDEHLDELTKDKP